MMKKTTDTGVISNKSIIRVMPGQCAVIIQNGKVLDATAEEGDYNFSESATPSFFAGNFGAVFKDMWQRFTFGGGIPNKQEVYFFNLKEIMDNKFGTATPIPYQDWSHPVPNQMTGGIVPLAVKVKCYGKYTFRISNPAVFLKEISGTADVYKKDDISEQMRTEVMSVFQNVLNELGTEKYKIPVIMEDERYTTVIVNNMLIDNNTRREKRKKVVDKLASTVILQGYLDRRNQNGE